MADNDFINRVKQPYRIYKPLYLDYKDTYSLKRDLDRELESISQCLLWVSQQFESIPVDNTISQIKDSITALSTRVSSLETRVTALENA